MDNKPSLNQAEMLAAFRADEAQQRLINTKVGAALVVFLMPVGSILDFYVYPEQLWTFFWLRWITSGLAALIWAFLFTRWGPRFCPSLGLIVAMLPVVFIAGMIGVEEGFGSPYYAGLNLVVLAVGIVLHWTVAESVLAVFLVLLIYLGAGVTHAHYFGHVPGIERMLVNNLYFIAEMDLIAVVGTYFQNRQRFREFALRYELDLNRHMLEETNQKLTELDQAKSRFFANISHELRTPLTLLIAPLENLIGRFGRSLDGDTKNLLLTMQSNGMRLLKLINDLLDLVRLESGRLEIKPEPVAMVEFVQGIVSSVRQVAEDKHLQIQSRVDPALGTVLTDRDKLEKIVLNLVFNALKFTPSGGRVEIRAGKQNEEMVIQVEDTGMGISAKNLPNVFSRFWQADDSSRRKYQGVGIGLALVKELVELQKGEVSVQSVEGKGTTFTICLPYQQAVQASVSPVATAQDQNPADGPAASSGTVSSQEWLSNLYRRAELFPALTPLQESMRPHETSQSKLPKVLVADDEPDMLRFLKSQLAERYNVLEAVDGQQAIEKASQFLPDVIVLDMMMPEKDGLQACKELRERTPTQSIPVVLLTARADEETKLAALSAGANDFLTKPFSSTELHVRLKNLVDSYHYQREVAKQNQALEQTIEQLKETEAQLIETEKMASLGRLSAGIMHEINNPLNFATTGLYTLRKKAKDIPAGQQAEYADIIKDIDDGLARVKTIVADLRSFSYQENESREPVPVAQAVQSSLRFLSHEWKEKVAVEVQVPEDQVIWANKNKLIQVFVNLLQNSLDALRHKEFKEGRPAMLITGTMQDGLSRLSFRDNGEGIPSNVMDKIFDPFFTTKDVGEGMGLGLSICYRIVQGFDGAIRVKSEPGQFCEFTLEFPLKPAQTEQRQAA